MLPVFREFSFNSYDPFLFETGLQNSLKEILPFDSLSLVDIKSNEELEAILRRIPFSDRQRERAKSHLLKGKSFWDRVLNQALVPIQQNGNGPVILCRLTGMPKNIGAEEGYWLLALASQVLTGKLESAKRESLFKEKQDVPLYIHLLLKNGNESFDIVELSFYSWPAQSLDNVKESLKSCFCADEVAFAGLTSGRSTWFLLKNPTVRKMDVTLMDLASRFRQAGYTPKILRFYDSVTDFNELSAQKILAEGAGAKIFSSSLAREFFNEIGVDSAIFSSLIGLRVSRSSVVGLFIFSSKEKAQRASRSLKGQVDVVTLSGNFLLVTLQTAAVKDPDRIQEVCQKVFDSVKSNHDKAVVAGFASPLQPLVTRENVFFASLFANYHARLLGPGNMALFDHVTCNVQGDVLFSWGDLAGAMACYRKGLLLKGDDINLLNSLGVCLADAARLRDAEHFFKKVLKVDPDNEMALYNLSGIYLRQSRFSRAMTATLRAIDKKNDNLVLLTRLLEIYVAKGSWSKAYEISNKILDSGRITGGTLARTCARVSIENGDWSRAKELLKACLKKNTEDPETLLLLAKGFWMFEKDLDTASRMLSGFWRKKPAEEQLKTEAMELQRRIDEK